MYSINYYINDYLPAKAPVNMEAEIGVFKFGKTYDKNLNISPSCDIA